MNHHHIDRRRAARSAECRMVGDAPTPPEEIERLVRRARVEKGVIVFRPEDLARMHPVARELIEGEHKRICGRRNGNG